MLWAFVEGSEIAPLIPHGDGSTDPTDLDVGRRRLRVRTGRRGNEIVVRDRERRRAHACRVEAAAGHGRHGDRATSTCRSSSTCRSCRWTR